VQRQQAICCWHFGFWFCFFFLFSERLYLFSVFFFYSPSSFICCNLHTDCYKESPSTSLFHSCCYSSAPCGGLCCQVVVVVALERRNLISSLEFFKLSGVISLKRLTIIELSKIDVLFLSPCSGS
jgi:hypothetical protein